MLMGTAVEMLYSLRIQSKFLPLSQQNQQIKEKRVTINILTACISHQNKEIIHTGLVGLLTNPADHLS